MRAFIVILFFLAGCASYPEYRSNIAVTVDQREDAWEYCSAALGYRSRACTERLDAKQCHIFITPDDAHERWEVLGEELAHCLFGDIHGDPRMMHCTSVGQTGCL